MAAMVPSAMSPDDEQTYRSATTTYQRATKEYRADGDYHLFVKSRADALYRCLPLGTLKDKLEANMSDPITPRDVNGFLPRELRGLNFNRDGNQLYLGVKGVKIDAAGDKIQLLMVPAEDPAEALLSAEDVVLVARHFITKASISLDPLSRKLGPEPLQQITIQPPCLAGSSIGVTMLHADMYLKWMSQGTEVSTKPPFVVRPMMIGLTARGLSDATAHHLRSVPQRKQEAREDATLVGIDIPTEPVACRMWFDCVEDVGYSASATTDGNGTTFDIEEANVKVCFEAFGEPERADSDGSRASRAADGEGTPDAVVGRSAAPVSGAGGADPHAPGGDFIERCGLVKWDNMRQSSFSRFVDDLNEHLDVTAEVLPQFARLREFYRLIGAFCLAQSEAVKLVEAHTHPEAIRNIANVASGSPCAFNPADGALTVMPASEAAAARTATWAPVLLASSVIPSSFVLTGKQEEIAKQVADAGEDGWVPPVGSVVDACDRYFTYYTAEVVNISAAGSQCVVLVHFDGWGAEMDEWIPLERIAPLHTHTHVGMRSSGRGAGTIVLPTAGSKGEVIVGSFSGAPLCVEATVMSCEGHGDAAKVKVRLCKDLRVPWLAAPICTDGQRLDIPIARFRLQLPAYTPTLDGVAAGVAGGGVHPGQNIDANDEFFTWHKAVIMDVNAELNRVCVHFHGYPKDWDLWIPCDTDHVAQIGEFTEWRPERVGYTVAPADGSEVLRRTNAGLPAPGFEEGLVKCTVIRQEGKGDQARVWVRDLGAPEGSPGQPLALNLLRLRKLPFDTLLAAPLDAHGRPNGAGLQVGQSLDVRDEGFGWYTASIVSVSAFEEDTGPADGGAAAGEKGRKVAITIRYDGWSSLWTEQIRLPSPRVRPLHTFTPRGFRSVKGRHAKVEVPEQGTKVLFQGAGTTLESFVIRRVEAGRVGLTRERGDTDGDKLEWIARPLKIGTIIDPDAVSGSSKCGPSSTWASTYGGVKLAPTMKRTKAVEPPSRLDFAVAAGMPQVSLFDPSRRQLVQDTTMLSARGSSEGGDVPGYPCSGRNSGALQAFPKSVPGLVYPTPATAAGIAAACRTCGVGDEQRGNLTPGQFHDFAATFCTAEGGRSRSMDTGSGGYYFRNKASKTVVVPTPSGTRMLLAREKGPDANLSLVVVEPSGRASLMEFSKVDGLRGPGLVTTEDVTLEYRLGQSSMQANGRTFDTQINGEVLRSEEGWHATAADIAGFLLNTGEIAGASVHQAKLHPSLSPISSIARSGLPHKNIMDAARSLIPARSKPLDLPVAKKQVRRAKKPGSSMACTRFVLPVDERGRADPKVLEKAFEQASNSGVKLRIPRPQKLEQFASDVTREVRALVKARLNGAHGQTGGPVVVMQKVDASKIRLSLIKEQPIIKGLQQGVDKMHRVLDSRFAKIGGQALKAGVIVYSVATADDPVQELAAQGGMLGVEVAAAGAVRFAVIESATAGAAAGANAGAAIGAWFGGVGAAPGAAVGAIIAGVAAGATAWLLSGQVVDIVGDGIRSVYGKAKEIVEAE